MSIFTYIHTYTYIILPINQLLVFSILDNTNKGILKLDKSNASGIAKLKFLTHKHDYRSCTTVTFIFLNDIYSQEI